jgi:hypothetical protein
MISPASLKTTTDLASIQTWGCAAAGVFKMITAASRSQAKERYLRAFKSVRVALTFAAGIMGE